MSDVPLVTQRVHHTPGRFQPLLPRGVDPCPSVAWLWVIPAVAAACIAAVYFTGSNERLFLWINQISRFTGPHIWAYLTIFGDSAVAFTVVLPLARHRPDIIWALFLAAILAFVWSTGLKDWLDTPRPPAVLAAGKFILIGPAPYYFSFPSGHSTTAFTLAGVMAMFSARTRWRVLFILFACGVALSRMAVGVHWPMDVLGGAFVGWLSAWLGVAWAGHWTWGLRTSGRWTLWLSLAAIAVFVFGFHDTGYTQSVWLQRTVSAAALIAAAVDLFALWRARSGAPTGEPS